MKKKILSLTLLFFTYVLTYILDASTGHAASRGRFLFYFIVPLGIIQYIFLFCYLLTGSRWFLVLQSAIFLFFLWTLAYRLLLEHAL